MPPQKDRALANEVECDAPGVDLRRIDIAGVDPRLGALPIDGRSAPVDGTPEPCAEHLNPLQVLRCNFSCSDQIELILFKECHAEPHPTASGQSVLGAEVFKLGKEHCNVTVILA